ncbi:MAG: L-threonylcarbamoyladenylate synthase [Spirochaetales bacterium]|uniref:L-threonylcarbamoyladenylate synthase n=1 Tax=Candidatus Thalassospirochaeta sargassi TaxID=3119039 RepID=A0AAJ1ML33_9SPIO|nr:L-threonylcarbamoyladenylate synthase [Spirochaetales bacterium]
MPDKRKAVFLDRDGTIMQDSGYLNSPDQVEFFDDTIAVLYQLQSEYELFIVTNQSGVGKGLITAEGVEKVNGYIDDYLRRSGIIIREWFVCTHTTEDNCECKKPKPYFLNLAAEKYGIDLSQSWVIGDHPHDISFADNGGAKGLYVLTGHGAKHLSELPHDVPVFHNLSSAAERILGRKTDGSKTDAPNFCSIEDGAAQLRKGGLTAFPTETVYGLGADVFNPEAVAGIFQLKGRPLFNPLIAHISGINMLEKLIKSISPTAEKLINAFWPGPLTLVFEKKDNVPDIVTGGNPTVAVRMPDHPMALELIRRADSPIAAPSANAFGKTSPTTALHVVEQLGVDGYKIIDGGACRVGVESTVLSLVHETPVLLRPGGLSVERIEEITGPVEHVTEPQLKNLESPGLLASHYSPHTPFILKNGEPEPNPEPATGLMLFCESSIYSAGPVEILSPAGSTSEAAVNLYAAMRRLDKMDLERIIAYRLPERGLGKAVNDRISKASVPAPNMTPAEEE